MLTLGNQRNLTNDMLIKGIIDSVVTVNQFYAMLPFKGIQGNALAYNRETKDFDQMALVDGGVNTAFSGINKIQQTFSRHSTELTTLIGDAQVNGLIQAVGSDYNDATAVQVAAKAKGLGRSFMNLLINGSKEVIVNVTSDTDVTAAAAVTALELGAIDAVFTLETDGTSATLGATNIIADATATRLTATADGAIFVGPYVTTATGGKYTASGAALQNALNKINVTTTENTRGASAFETNGWASFDGLSTFVRASKNVLAARVAADVEVLDYLDAIIDRVHDKDGMVDYLMLNSAGVRKITAAFRATNTGADMMDVKTSSGAVMSIQSYRGVPIFRNDFIGREDLTTGYAGGDGTDSTTIYAGTLDDGSLSHGICGLTALKSAGMQVQRLGAMEDIDADITRVKWYCGLAHFSELGLVKGSI